MNQARSSGNICMILRWQSVDTVDSIVQHVKAYNKQPVRILDNTSNTSFYIDLSLYNFLPIWALKFRLILGLYVWFF